MSVNSSSPPSKKRKHFPPQKLKAKKNKKTKKKGQEPNGTQPYRKKKHKGKHNKEKSEEGKGKKERKEEKERKEGEEEREGLVPVNYYDPQLLLPLPLLSSPSCLSEPYSSYLEYSLGGTCGKKGIRGEGNEERSLRLALLFAKSLSPPLLLDFLFLLNLNYPLRKSMEIYMAVTYLQPVWRACLQRKRLKILRKNREHRKKVVGEMYSTEEQYVHNLKYLINGYITPLFHNMLLQLQHAPKFQQLSSNAKMICNFNTTFLEELKERIEKWGEREVLGDVVLSMSHWLTVYTSYIMLYNESLQEFEVLISEFPQIESYLWELRGEDNLEIYSLLILPVQRIPRYRLFLEDLEKHTPEEHEDKQNLRSALEQVCKVADKIDSQYSEFEKLKVLSDIQKRILGNKSRIISPSRRFVQEGTMKTALPGKKLKSRVVFLFSDLVLIASPCKTKIVKKQDILKWKAEYHLTRICPVLVNDESGCGISLIDIGGITMATLFFSEEKELNSWMLAIQKIKKAMEANRKDRHKLIMGRARSKTEGVKTALAYNYQDGGSESETDPIGGRNGAWATRLAALKEKRKAKQFSSESGTMTVETDKLRGSSGSKRLSRHARKKFRHSMDVTHFSGLGLSHDKLKRRSMRATTNWTLELPFDVGSNVPKKNKRSSNPSLFSNFPSPDLKKDTVITKITRKLSQENTT